MDDTISMVVSVYNLSMPAKIKLFSFRMSVTLLLCQDFTYLKYTSHNLRPRSIVGELSTYISVH